MFRIGLIVQGYYISTQLRKSLDLATTVCPLNLFLIWSRSTNHLEFTDAKSPLNQLDISVEPIIHVECILNKKTRMFALKKQFYTLSQFM